MGNVISLTTKTIGYLALVISLLIYILPFWIMIDVAFGGQIFRRTPELFPSKPTLRGFINILTYPGFIYWLRNSFIYSISMTLGILFLSSLVGYAFSRLEFPGKSLLFWLVLIAMMIPGTALYIPLYITLRNLGLLNTMIGIILPPIVSPYSAFLLKQAFDSIPKDWEEAALIDGASTLEIIFKVLLPIVKPTLITLGLFTYIWNWNNFVWPLFVANSSLLWNLPLGVWMLSWSYTVIFDYLAAGAIITCLLYTSPSPRDRG